jgi:excisionase family DNA binding protein
MSEPTEAAVLTVPEAARLLRLSRSHAYEAVKAGHLPSVIVGRSVRVPTERLMAMIAGEPTADKTS